MLYCQTQIWPPALPHKTLETVKPALLHHLTQPHASKVALLRVDLCCLDTTFAGPYDSLTCGSQLAEKAKDQNRCADTLHFKGVFSILSSRGATSESFLPLWSKRRNVRDQQEWLKIGPFIRFGHQLSNPLFVKIYLCPRYLKWSLVTLAFTSSPFPLGL